MIIAHVFWNVKTYFYFFLEYLGANPDYDIARTVTAALSLRSGRWDDMLYEDANVCCAAARVGAGLRSNWDKK